MKLSPKAATLLFLEDQGVAALLAFCVSALCRKRQGLTILGYHVGTGHDDFPRFLASELHCMRVNALLRKRIHIGGAGNGVVLAVVVRSGMNFNRLPFRIRDFDSDLETLSDGFMCQRYAL